MDQPFGGLKGRSVEYGSVKKVTFGRAPRLAMTSDMLLYIYVENRSRHNRDLAFFLDAEWTARVSELLKGTPMGSKLSA